MKEIWTTVASMMGVWAFAQTLLLTVFPPELRLASLKFLHRLSSYFSRHCYYDITEIDGINTNELYNAVQIYLTSSASASASISSTRLTLTRDLNSSSVNFGFSGNDRLVDNFLGTTVEWEHVVTQRQSQASISWHPVSEEKRAFTLRAPKNITRTFLTSYLDHITETAAQLRHRNQDRLLYANSGGISLDGRANPWESVPFKHPSTFDTLAIDPAKKEEIIADLTDFSSGESIYRKTGRAWKRGYLLYGPPGTGKSSMIAAMANYLGYDIYDLDLTGVSSNSDLRKLLMKTKSKSIIVVEDIDCSVNLTNNKTNNVNIPNLKPARFFESLRDESSNTITLSGLLNFTDGLWSCCGSERMFVFTTNQLEKLDPALLRRGRMDMHIHMSYCSAAALKILLRNYLGVEEGDLDEGVMEEMERLIEKAAITPADVSEILIKNRRVKSKAVDELLETLRTRAERNSQTKLGRKIGNAEEREEEKIALDQSCSLSTINICEEEEKFN